MALTLVRDVADARTITRTAAADTALENARLAAAAPQAGDARRDATQAALGRLGAVPDSPLGRQLAAVLGDVWRAGVVYGYEAARDDASFGCVS